MAEISVVSSVSVLMFKQEDSELLCSDALIFCFISNRSTLHTALWRSSRTYGRAQIKTLLIISDKFSTVD